MILKTMVTSRYTIVCCAAKYNQCRYTTDKCVLYRNQENVIFMLDSTYTICTVETPSGWSTFCSKPMPPLRYAPSKFILISSFVFFFSFLHPHHLECALVDLLQIWRAVRASCSSNETRDDGSYERKSLNLAC